MAGNTEILQSLIKALEAGNYNAAPSTLVQGSALQVEDLSAVMEVVTFGEQHIKLQKLMKSESCRSTLAQFDRQLSYGMFGGSAQVEGAVGQEETSDFVRVVVPMAYYSHTRRVTLVSTMVQTVDGKKSDERAAEDAAKKIAADIEFDLFRGKSDFSNAGVFDGNPAAVASLPNLKGLDVQVRESDGQMISRDLMFSEYGSDLSVVISGGGVLSQDMIEDSWTRSVMNMGEANLLLVDPLVLSAYNKLTYADKQRIVLAGSAQEMSGADLNRQAVAGGEVKIQASRFLSGKFQPQAPRALGPSAPTVVITDPVGTTPFLTTETYKYIVTAVNEIGESPPSIEGSDTPSATGDEIWLTITPSGSGVVRYYNVYRTPANVTSTLKRRFIGRVKADGASAVVFVDLGNKIPGFVTGFLVQGDTMGMKEMAPYSRLKLAVADLSIPEAHFRFTSLAVFQPRKNVLIDNLKGSL
jgi:hypothetical protein